MPRKKQQPAAKASSATQAAQEILAADIARKERTAIREDTDFSPCSSGVRRVPRFLVYVSSVGRSPIALGNSLMVT